MTALIVASLILVTMPLTLPIVVRLTAPPRDRYDLIIGAMIGGGFLAFFGLMMLATAAGVG